MQADGVQTNEDFTRPKIYIYIDTPSIITASPAMLYASPSAVPPSCEPSPLRPLPALLEDAPLVAFPTRKPIELLVGPTRVKVHRAVAANTLQPGQGEIHGCFLLDGAGVAVNSLGKIACIYIETFSTVVNSCYEITLSRARNQRKEVTSAIKEVL